MIQIVALLSVFGLGISFSLLGALKLGIVKNLGIDDTKFGTLISALMFTSIFIVLAFGPIVDTFGYKPVAIIGFVLGFIAVYMLVNAKTYSTALISCIVLGVGAMCMNLGNTLIPMVLFEGNTTAASNFGNVFFGVGAFITPLIAGALIGKMGFQKTGMVIAIILLAPVIFALIATFPALETTGVTLGTAIASMFGLLASPAVIVSALALFCYIGLEASMGGWITTYLSSVGFAEKSANYVLSGFWIALMVARLVMTAVITPEIGSIIVVILALLAVVSIGLMILASKQWIAGIAVLVTGFAFGPIFPTIVGVTFHKVGDESLYGSAFGIIFAVGLLGGTTIPAAIGIFSKGKTIQKSLSIAMVAALLLFIIGIIMSAV